MAFQIDGKKDRMVKKINMRDVLMMKGKAYKFTQQNPTISLIYRAELKLQDEKMNTEQPKKVEQPKKNPKILRFDDDVPNTK